MVEASARLYILQRGVQWKQDVVIRMLLYTILLYNTSPIHCTPLPLHPPLMNTQGSAPRATSCGRSAPRRQRETLFFVHAGCSCVCGVLVCMWGACVYVGCFCVQHDVFKGLRPPEHHAEHSIWTNNILYVLVRMECSVADIEREHNLIVTGWNICNY